MDRNCSTCLHWVRREDLHHRDVFVSGECRRMPPSLSPNFLVHLLARINDGRPRLETESEFFIGSLGDTRWQHPLVNEKHCCGEYMPDPHEAIREEFKATKGSVFQRKSDGRWCGTYYTSVDGERKRKQIYGATKEEVEQRLFVLNDSSNRRKPNGEGTIFKRKKGGYAGRLHVLDEQGNKVRKTVYGRTEEIVLSKIEALRDESSQNAEKQKSPKWTRAEVAQ